MLKYILYDRVHDKAKLVTTNKICDVEQVSSYTWFTNALQHNIVSILAIEYFLQHYTHCTDLAVPVYDYIKNISISSEPIIIYQVKGCHLEAV